MSQSHQTCRKCGQFSFDPSYNMLKTGVRHWKHFRCLTDAEVARLTPGNARRFETWRLDHPDDRKAVR